MVANRTDYVRMLVHKGAKKSMRDRTDETPYLLGVRVGAPQVPPSCLIQLLLRE